MSTREWLQGYKEGYKEGYEDGLEQSTEQIQPSAYSNTHQQEPVAWRFQSAVGGWAYGKEPPIGSKYAVEPLYTHPQETTRKPLTRKQIREIEVDVSLNQSFDYITPAEQLCRAIEAAHGITGEKE